MQSSPFACGPPWRPISDCEPMARPGAPAPRSADDPWLCGPASLGVCYFVGSASRPRCCGVWATGGANTETFVDPALSIPEHAARSLSATRGARPATMPTAPCHHVEGSHATSSLGEGPSAAQHAIGIGHVAWQRPIRLPAVPVVRRASPPGREGCNLPRQSADTSTARPRARSASRIGRTWTAQPEVAEQVLLDRPPGRGSGRVEAEGQVGGRAYRSSSRTMRPPRALSRPCWARS